MTAIASDIESVTLNGRLFAVPSDITVSRKIGGFENTVLPNGDGTARLKKMRAVPGWEGLAVQVDDTRGDQEFLQELANLSEFWPLAMTYGSGAIWQGSVQIVEAIQYDNQETTATLAVQGEGTLTQQQV